MGSGRFTRRLLHEHCEVQAEVLGLGVFHERPLVAEPAAVTAFEQIEERPAVVTLHQRRFEKLDDLRRREFQRRERVVGGNGFVVGCFWVWCSNFKFCRALEQITVDRMTGNFEI